MEGFLICTIILLVFWPGSSRDDSDDPKGKRSGMAVYVDHRTGLHYLAPMFGGLTPRLDRDGKQICEDK